MLAALREMVNTDGGSYDKAGVDAVGAQVRRFMAAHGIPVETVPRETLRRLPEGARRGRRCAAGRRQCTRGDIVLMGHRDTVFPKGEPERRPFRIEGGRAYGPGVADMKAGLVMNMFVLAAFKQFGGAPGAAARPVHRRRGDRLARGPRGDRGGRRARRGWCSTPSPAGPRAASSPGARAASSRSSTSRARRRIPAAISRPASAPSASWRARSRRSTR